MLYISRATSVYRLFTEIAPPRLMLFGVALLLPLEFFSHLLDKAFKLI